jgi:hypothetical protein
MTTPKVGTIQRGGSRFYVHPSTRGKVPGVTSVVGMLPKEFLKFWAAKVVAECAVENLQSVVGLAMNDPKGAVDYLKRAPMRNTGEAADTGTQVHDLIEKMARGQKVGRVHPDLAGFVAGFQEWLDLYEPEFLFLEETVWSEAHEYAGSFDWIARMGDTPTTRRLEMVGETILGDNKTTRSGVHAEVALQLSAYKRADYILRQDGSKLELPAIDGAAVLWLRPEEWSFVPVNVGDEVFDVFLSLLPVLHWERELKKSALGAPLN